MSKLLINSKQTLVEYDKVQYVATPSDSSCCAGCALFKLEQLPCPPCTSGDRKDNTNVIFVPRKGKEPEEPQIEPSILQVSSDQLEVIYKDQRYVAIPVEDDSSCRTCVFRCEPLCPPCGASDRKDNLNVIYIKPENGN